MTSEDSPPTRTETLEVPTVPSSRFVLPPPPSDLLNRLQAFLPQMKAANEQLADQMEDGEAAEQDEGVVLQIVDSDEESSSSDDDSDSDSSDEEVEGAEQGGSDRPDDNEGETMARLLDISARPTKKLPAAKDGASKGAGIVEME